MNYFYKSIQYEKIENMKYIYDLFKFNKEMEYYRIYIQMRHNIYRIYPIYIDKFDDIKSYIFKNKDF